MAHPVVHAEIRSQDPDATRRFFADLFGWKIASEGAFPGYTFIDTGAQGGTFVAISPRQSTEDGVLFFVAVEDVEATLARAEQLGGSIVQPAQNVPGTSFGCSRTPRATRWVWLPPDSWTGARTAQRRSRATWSQDRALISMIRSGRGPWRRTPLRLRVGKGLGQGG